MRKVLIGLIAIMMLLAACAGEKLTDNDQLPPPPGDDKVVQVQDAGGDTAGDAAGDTAGDTSDVKSEFESLAKKAEGATFKVTYKTTDSFSGSDGEFVMYSKGKKSRMDTKSTYEGQLMESQVFNDGDSVTMCNKDGDWTCFIMEDMGDTGNTPAEFQDEWDKPDVDVTKTSSRKVAGTTADCYEVSVTMPDGVAKQEVCVSKEGVMLYMNVETPQGTMSWEATTYSTSVSDSAFEPPAEPQDMDAMMQQMMGGGDFDPSATE